MSTPPPGPRPFAISACILGLGLAIFASPERATALAPPESADGAEAEVEEQEPPPTWRFRDADRPIKVVVLAGSVGAWQRGPYAEHIENWCSQVEVKNLSKTGYGAYQLRRRFMDQFIANRYVNLRAPDYEYWLVFQGGLNSVGMPEKTNQDIRKLFMAAHERGIGVVALSLTPWGDESDAKRWRGIAGLDSKANTQKVVGYELGRLSPHEALGRYVAHRDQPDAPWDPAELPDIAIDLYDSPMRDHGAALRDFAQMRRDLERSKDWQRRFAELDESTRELALDEQAQRAAELPQWFMREELRSFDDIHPNEHGHRLIAELACPELPKNWSCECP